MNYLRSLRRQLDRPIQIEELPAALQSMQGRRAPGINSLMVEFYKAFWPHSLGQQNCHLQVTVYSGIFDKTVRSNVERCGQLHIGE